MRSSSLGVVFCLGVGACGGPVDDEPPPPAPKTEVPCKIGLTDDVGTFSPMGEGAKAELVLGFQGFLFVEVHVQTGDVESGRADVRASVSVDGEDPFGTNQRGVAVEARADGTGLSDAVLLFLDSSNIAEYKDRHADLRLRMDGDIWTCTATASATFVDDDPCIHTDAEAICPGDGG